MRVGHLVFAAFISEHYKQALKPPQEFVDK